MRTQWLNIKRDPVTSETFDSVGYDPDQRILQLAFKDDRIYNYFDVPAYIYEDMMKADSKGKFFHRHILNQYEYEQIM